MSNCLNQVFPSWEGHVTWSTDETRFDCLGISTIVCIPNMRLKTSKFSYRNPKPSVFAFSQAICGQSHDSDGFDVGERRNLEPKLWVLKMEKNGGANCVLMQTVWLQFMLPTLPKTLFKRMGKLATSMSSLRSPSIPMCCWQVFSQVFDVCNETIKCVLLTFLNEEECEWEIHGQSSLAGIVHSSWRIHDSSIDFCLPKTRSSEIGWLQGRRRMMWSIEGLSCWVVELGIVIGWGQADRKPSANVAWGECIMEWRSLWKRWTSRGAWREPRSWAMWAGCEAWSPEAPLWMEMRTRDTLPYIMLLAMAMSKLASSLCRYFLSLSLSFSFCMFSVCGFLPLDCLWLWRWEVWLLVTENEMAVNCWLAIRSPTFGGSQNLDNRI